MIEQNGKYLDPKVDVCFKFILSDEEICTAIINDILEAANLPKIKKILDFNSEIIDGENIMRHGVTLDFVCEDETGQIIDIEMQRRKHSHLEARLIFYLTQIFSTQIKRGSSYPDQKISKTIIIFL